MTSTIAILFANLRGNLGDFAILHAMLRDLTLKFPDRALHVYSHGFQPIDQRRLAAFQAASDVEFEVIGATPHFRVDPRLPIGLLQLSGAWPLVQAKLIASFADHVAPQAEKFRSYEAIAVAGGDYGGGSRTNVSLHGILSAIHRYNERIYAYPLSVNRGMRRNYRKRDVQQHFKRIRQPVIARDGISKGILSELGVEARLGVDAVFSLRHVADKVAAMKERDHTRILFVLTGKKLKAELARVLLQIAPLNVPVALMTTCEVVDGKQCEALAEQFGIDYYAPATWQEAVAEMKASSLVVTNRLHGLIFGSLAKAPMLPVMDRTKSEAFAKDAKLPYAASDIRSLNDALLGQCRANRDVILEAMNKYGSCPVRAEYSPLWAD